MESLLPIADLFYQASMKVLIGSPKAMAAEVPVISTNVGFQPNIDGYVALCKVET
jgi:hypothetical protein